MLEPGWTISAIRRHLGLDRKTIRRFKNIDLDVLLSSARDLRPNGVTGFTSGNTSGTLLFQEIRQRCYCGSIQVVRDRLGALKADTAAPVRVAVPARARSRAGS